MIILFYLSADFPLTHPYLTLGDWQQLERLLCILPYPSAPRNTRYARQHT